MKVKNLRRDPRAWVCAFPDAFYGGPFVQVEGDVSIVELPDAMDGLVDYYRSVSGEHPDWDDYRAAMERDQRVLIRLALTRAGADASGEPLTWPARHIRVGGTSRADRRAHAWHGRTPRELSRGSGSPTTATGAR